MKDYRIGAEAHEPYQCFMGRWEGVCKTFSPNGEFIEASTVHMDVYWNEDGSWHLHEHFDNLYEVGETVFHSDFQMNGKVCTAKNEAIEVIGVGLTPYNYNFIIESNVTKTTVFNNHYFIAPDQRRIITHKLRGGKTHIFQIQDFVRLGFDAKMPEVKNKK